MIFQTSIVLWAVLVVAAVRYKSVPAAIFVSCAIVHQVFCGGIDGPRYYVTAGAFDALAVVLLWRWMVYDRRRTIATRLQVLSLVSAVVNFAGLMLYEAEFEMTPYKLAGLVLYCAAISIVIGGSSGVGWMGTGLAELRPHLCRGRKCVQEKQA